MSKFLGMTDREITELKGEALKNTAAELQIEGRSKMKAAELREAIRALLLANNGDPLDPAVADALNRTAATAPLELRFSLAGGAELRPTAADVPGALARLLGVVFASMLEGTWPRLKACRSETCRWAFYDGSKNRSGTWCTMAVCGSRQKARAYRARRAQARTAS